MSNSNYFTLTTSGIALLTQAMVTGKLVWIPFFEVQQTLPIGSVDLVDTFKTYYNVNGNIDQLPAKAGTTVYALDNSKLQSYGVSGSNNVTYKATLPIWFPLAPLEIPYTLNSCFIYAGIITKNTLTTSTGATSYTLTPILSPALSGGLLGALTIYINYKTTISTVLTDQTISVVSNSTTPTTISNVPLVYNNISGEVTSAGSIDLTNPASPVFHLSFVGGVPVPDNGVEIVLNYVSDVTLFGAGCTDSDLSKYPNSGNNPGNTIELDMLLQNENVTTTVQPNYIFSPQASFQQIDTIAKLPSFAKIQSTVIPTNSVPSNTYIISDLDAGKNNLLARMFYNSTGLDFNKQNRWNFEQYAVLGTSYAITSVTNDGTNTIITSADAVNAIVESGYDIANFIIECPDATDQSCAFILSLNETTHEITVAGITYFTSIQSSVIMLVHQYIIAPPNPLSVKKFISTDNYQILAEDDWLIVESAANNIILPTNPIANKVYYITNNLATTNVPPATNLVAHISPAAGQTLYVGYSYLVNFRDGIGLVCGSNNEWLAI